MSTPKSGRNGDPSPLWDSSSPPAPAPASCCNPVVDVIRDGGTKINARFIVAGGVQFVGGLVDIEDQLAGRSLFSHYSSCGRPYTGRGGLGTEFLLPKV
ncbi:hypothetical protein Taro_033387 [Colocasia esculenta]|uniref:Uncharacterized protein n=1 Tax=Colocasia esculenta TaxID=4460 RepID=A0A843W1H3_COLES|nr:hypothetical protein [Colocasia esculenta]